MKIEISKNIKNLKGLVVLAFHETEQKLTFPEGHDFPTVSPALFSGKKGSKFIIENKDRELTYIYLGLGKNPEYKTIKTAFRILTAKQADLIGETISLVITEGMEDEFLEAAVSGLNMGTYRLGHYKKMEEPAKDWKNLKLQIFTDLENADEIASKAIKISNAQLEGMKMVDLPPNKATPQYLADWAISAGSTFGFKVDVLGRERAAEEGLKAFLAVSQGSSREPQFIIAEYSPKQAGKHIGLVGKGVTFDTGGLNIKTAGMVHMKCDMGGAAAVLAAMQLIADLQLPIKVTAIVPCVENSVDKDAFLPSDIIGSHSGKTIEIIDTDAEGRLILADGLSYLIANYAPDTIIDVATLTGSSVGTFGYECAALFTNDSTLSQLIQESGEQVGERVWPLPLWDVYKQDIESDIADVRNYSGKPFAGAITAAKFLESFTSDHPSWAHIDIAGTAFGDSEFGKSKHATAYGIHLLLKLIEKL